MVLHRVAIAVSLSTAGLTLAGCSSSSSPKAHGTTPPTSSSSTTASSSTASVPSSSPPTGGSTVPSTSVPICTVQNLKGSFSVIPGSAAAGHVEARVVLTNSSSATCRTFGYVGMQLLDSGGVPLPTDVVRQPGTTQTVTLNPGQSTSAVAQFSPDIPGQGDSTTGNCQPVAQSTRITPPNDTRFFVVQGPGQSVCERGTIDLRPLQPGATAGP